MITRIAGRLESVGELSVLVERDGLAYEVLIPRFAASELAGRIGNLVVLYTVHYIEGNAIGANFIPRLIGFLSEIDREFFTCFTSVKGVGMRKALRAMNAPVQQIAAAIESGDEHRLTALPEIGKKLAAQMITDLRGELGRFAATSRPGKPLPELTEGQRVALDILVQWGDRRVDAQRWVAAAVEADSSLRTPDEIVKAAYRIKQVAPA